MRVYRRSDSHFLCGIWNGSPIEVALAERMTGAPAGESYHSHPFREYILVVDGWVRFLVDGEEVHVEEGALAMFDVDEPHKLLGADPRGSRWVLVKERSDPAHGKVLVAEPDTEP